MLLSQYASNPELWVVPRRVPRSDANDANLGGNEGVPKPTIHPSSRYGTSSGGSSKSFDRERTANPAAIVATPNHATASADTQFTVIQEESSGSGCGAGHAKRM